MQFSTTDIRLAGQGVSNPSASLHIKVLKRFRSSWVTEDYDETYRQTKEWFDQLKATLAPEAMVEPHERRLASAKGVAERKYIYDCLNEVFTRCKRLDDVLTVRLRYHDEFPDDPLTSLGIAGFYLSAVDEPLKATLWLEKAEVAARATGRFIRFVLHDKARAALELNDYGMLERCLVELAQLRIRRDTADIRRERDFFDRADKARLSKEVVEKYEAYLSADPQTLYLDSQN